VPRDGFYCEESWSEWQDLNLRPPPPERGTLDHRTRYGNPYSSRRVKLPMSFPIRISGKRRLFIALRATPAHPGAVADAWSRSPERGAARDRQNRCLVVRLSKAAGSGGRACYPICYHFVRKQGRSL